MVLACEMIRMPDTQMPAKGFLLDVFCRKLRYATECGLSKFPGGAELAQAEVAGTRVCSESEEALR